jgi:tRNA 2-selenouridine synthase
VRSEGEFGRGAVPGFACVPILEDKERHLVGIAYKQHGQAAAIALGHQLVDPLIAGRVARWRALAEATGGEAVVACWRGGLRSQLACEQLALAGCRPLRVLGGYKAMRNELMRAFSEPPPLLVVGGLTGSGKTELIASLPAARRVDLERLAAHRGSSFGSDPFRPQPAQASFENELAVDLRAATSPVAVEDESRTIGRVYVPGPLFAAMQAAPVVIVETPIAERTVRLYREYVETPLRLGVPVAALSERLAASIRALTRRLGGALARQIESGVAAALAAGRTDLDTHGRWIELLLAEYYDKRYQHAFARTPRTIAFQGSLEECRQWILQPSV